MRWFFFVLFIGTSLANAQTIFVKSGEHDGFTRLVFYNDTAQDLQVLKRSSAYLISHGLRKSSYDISEAFDKVTSKRLKRLQYDSEGGNLRMELNCDCLIETFDYTDKISVLDIKDGGGETGGHARFVQEENTHIERRALDFHTMNQIVYERYKVKNTRMFLEKGIGNTFDARETVGTFKDNLLEKLGMSATNGHIIVRPDSMAFRDEDSIPMSKKFSKNTPYYGENYDEMEINQVECSDQGELDLSAWLMEEGPLDALSFVYSTILTEFDTPHKDSVLNAVKTQIYYGFGAEARQLARNFLNAADIPESFVALSYMVENERSPQKYFENMHRCSDHHALWAVLETDEIIALRDLSGESVVRGYLKLPKHLRAVLGVSLAHKLADRGDHKSADIVYRSLSRAIYKDEGSVQNLAIKLAYAHKDWDLLINTLHANQAHKASVEGVLMLADAYFDKKIPLDHNDMLLLEAIYFESAAKRDDTPHRLRGALARMYALLNDYDSAFKFASPEIVLDVWEILANSNSENAFLQHVGTLGNEYAASFPLSLQEKIAQRLIGLGLEALALEIFPDFLPPPVTNNDIVPPPEFEGKDNFTGDESTPQTISMLKKVLDENIRTIEGAEEQLAIP